MTILACLGMFRFYVLCRKWSLVNKKVAVPFFKEDINPGSWSTFDFFIPGQEGYVVYFLITFDVHSVELSGQVEDIYDKTDYIWD